MGRGPGPGDQHSPHSQPQPHRAAGDSAGPCGPRGFFVCLCLNICVSMLLFFSRSPPKVTGCFPRPGAGGSLPSLAYVGRILPPQLVLVPPRCDRLWLCCWLKLAADRGLARSLWTVTSKVCFLETSRKFCFAGRPVRRAAGGEASLIPVTEGFGGIFVRPRSQPSSSSCRPLPKGRWQVQKQGSWCSPQVRNPVDLGHSGPAGY